MKKILFTLLGVLCVYASMAQTKVVGTLTSSDDGKPIPFATIIVKGNTKLGITTDDNGKYVIPSVQGNATLIFSCIGFSDQEVPVNNRAIIDVALAPNTTALAEVMVVAYGSAKKSSFTGSATTVSSEKIEKVQVSSVTQALQGVSSGVQVLNTSGTPGANAEVIIRGVGSINASSAPLYVVDGAPYAGSLNAISPSDIESMTILKDASAASLYGSRAANGVVMITTKSGKSGKGVINFKSTFGASSLAVSFPRSLNPAESYEMTWESIYNQQKDEGATDAASRQYATDNVVTEIKINPFSVSKPVGLDGKIAPSTQLLFEGDWKDELLKPRLRQEYALDFSGASENGNTRYFISGSYLNDKGTLTTQQFERYSGRANVSSKLRKWLEVGVNSVFSNSVQNAAGASGASSIWFVRSISSVYPVYEWDYTKQQYKLDDAGSRIYDYGNDRKEWVGWNPLADAAYGQDIIGRDNLNTRTYAEITFMPSLKFRTNFSMDYLVFSQKSYDSATHGFSAGYGGGAAKTMDRTISLTVSNLLTYEKIFGTHHHINVLLGQEAYKYKFNRLYGAKEGFPFGGLYELGSAAVLKSADSFEDNYRLLSFLSRVEYDFKDRYYVSASFRTDGSSRFSSESRWGNFWSVGASWRASEEGFMQGISWADNIKLKASYGSVGNDKLNTYYAYQGLYDTGYNNYTTPGLMISSLPNLGLKWESNMQFNVGLDFRLFNRIDGGIEWFNRTSKDLLFGRPMALSTGHSSITKNIGTVQNSGIELQLTANPIIKKNFRWTIDFNLTHYQNKIVKLPQEVMYSGYNRWEEGRSRYDFWGPEFAGVNPENGKSQWWINEFKMENGKPVLDANSNKTVIGRSKTENYNNVNNNDQKAYLGSAIPDVFGGFINTFHAYGFDASIFLYYSIGGKLYDNDYAGMMGYRVGFTLHEDILNRWTPENTSSNVPRMSKTDASYMNSYSSRLLFDNTFVRLRNVTLGYTLPKRLSEKVGISNLRVFVQGDNLLTFGSAASRGTDPEQGFDGATGTRFPVTKTVSGGLQVSF